MSKSKHEEKLVRLSLVEEEEYVLEDESWLQGIERELGVFFKVAAGGECW